MAREGGASRAHAVGVNPLVRAEETRAVARLVAYGSDNGTLTMKQKVLHS